MHIYNLQSYEKHWCRDTQTYQQSAGLPNSVSEFNIHSCSFLYDSLPIRFLVTVPVCVLVGVWVCVGVVGCLCMGVGMCVVVGVGVLMCAFEWFSFILDGAFIEN